MNKTDCVLKNGVETESHASMPETGEGDDERHDRRGRDERGKDSRLNFA